MRHPRFPLQGSQNFRPNSESLLGPMPFTPSSLLRGPYPRIPGPRFVHTRACGSVNPWPSFHDNVRFSSTQRINLQPHFSALPRPHLQRRTKPVIFPSGIRQIGQSDTQSSTPSTSNVEASSNILKKKVTTLNDKRVDNSKEGEVVAQINNNVNVISNMQTSRSSNIIESGVQSNAQEETSLEPDIVKNASSSRECSAASQLKASKEESLPTRCETQVQSSQKVIKLKRSSTNYAGKPKTKPRCKIRDHRPIPWPIGTQIKKEPEEELPALETSHLGTDSSPLRNCASTPKPAPIKVKKELPLPQQSPCATKVSTSKVSKKRKIELIRPSFSGLKTIKKEKLDEPLNDSSCDIPSNPFNSFASVSVTSSTSELVSNVSINSNNETTIVPSVTLAPPKTNSADMSTVKRASVTTDSSLSVSTHTSSVPAYNLEAVIQPHSEESLANSSASFCTFPSTQIACEEDTSQGPEENMLLTQSESYLDMIYSDLSQSVELRLANFFPLLSSAQIIKVFGFCGKVLNWEDCDVAEQGRANESLVCLRGSFAAGLAVEVLNGASLGVTKLSVAPHNNVASSALQALPPEVVHSDVSVQCLQSIQAFLVSEGLSDFLPPPAYSHLHSGDAEQSSRSTEVPPAACFSGARITTRDASAAQSAHLEGSLTVIQSNVSATNFGKSTSPICGQSSATNSALPAANNNNSADKTSTDISGPSLIVSVGPAPRDTATSTCVMTSVATTTVSAMPSLNVAFDAVDVTVPNVPEQHDCTPSDNSALKESCVPAETVSGIASSGRKKRKKIKLAVRNSKRPKPSSDDGLEPLALSTINKTKTEIVGYKTRSMSKGRHQQHESIMPQSTNPLPQVSQKNYEDQVSVPSVTQENISPAAEPVGCDTLAAHAIQYTSDAVETPFQDGKAIVSSENEENGVTENRVAFDGLLVERCTMFPSASQSSGVDTSVHNNIVTMQDKSEDNPRTTNINKTKSGVIECEDNEDSVLRVATPGCESRRDNAAPNTQSKSLELKTSSGDTMKDDVAVSIKQERDETTVVTEALSATGTTSTVVLKDSGKLTKFVGHKSSKKTVKKLQKNQKPTQATTKPHDDADVKPDVKQLEKNLLRSRKKKKRSQSKQIVTEKEKVSLPGVGLGPGGVQVKTEPVDACEEESCLPGFDFSSTFGEDRKPLMSSESTADDAAQLVDCFRDQISALLPSPIKSGENTSLKAEQDSETQITELQIPESQIPEPQIPEPQIPEPQIPQLQIPEPQIPQPQIPGPQIPGPQIPEPQIPQLQIPEPDVDLNVSHADSFQEDDYMFDDGLSTIPPLGHNTDTDVASPASVLVSPTSANAEVLTDAANAITTDERSPKKATDGTDSSVSSLATAAGVFCGAAATTSGPVCPRQSISPAASAPLSSDVHINLLKFKKVPCRVNRCRQQSCPYFHDDSDYIRDYRKYKGVKCKKVFAHFQHRWREPRFCDRGVRCAFAHNQLEYLFHPSNYKRFACSSLGLPVGSCLFKENCAFRHTHREITREEVKKQQDLWMQREREELALPTAAEVQENSFTSSPDTVPRCDSQPSDARFGLSESGLRVTASQVSRSSEAGLKLSQVSNVCASHTDQSQEAGQRRLTDLSPKSGHIHSMPSSEAGPRISVKASLFFQDGPVRASSANDYSEDHASVAQPERPAQSAAFEVTSKNLFTPPTASDSPVDGHAHSIVGPLRSSGKHLLNSVIGDRVQSNKDLRYITDDRRHPVCDQRKSIDDQSQSVGSRRHSVDRQRPLIDVSRHSANVLRRITDDRRCLQQDQRNSSADQPYSVDGSSCSQRSADNTSSRSVFGTIPFESSVKIERLSPGREILPREEEAQRDYTTYKKNLVTSDECKEITPLERQVQATYPTIPSLGNALVGLKVVENLKMLNDSHIHFGFVGSVLPIIHRKASELLRSGGSPLSVFNDSDNITLLSLLLQKMPKLEASLGSLVPIGKLKQALLEIVAEVDNSTDVQRDDYLGLDVSALARSTMGFSAQQIQKFVEHVLVCDGQSLPSAQQVQIIGMAVAGKHFKMSQGRSSLGTSVGIGRAFVSPQSRYEIQPSLAKASSSRGHSPLSEQATNLPSVHDKLTGDHVFPIVPEKLIRLPPPPVKPACRHGLPPLAAKPFDRLHDQRKVASVTPSVVLQTATHPPNLQSELPSRRPNPQQRLPLSTNTSDPLHVDAVHGYSRNDESRSVSSFRQTSNFGRPVDGFLTSLREQVDNSTNNLITESLDHRRRSPDPDFGSNDVSAANYPHKSVERRTNRTDGPSNRLENSFVINPKHDIDLRCFAPDTVDAFNIRIPDAFGPRSPSTEDIAPSMDLDTDQDMRKQHDTDSSYLGNARHNTPISDAGSRPCSRDWTKQDERDAHIRSKFRENCGAAENGSKKQVFVWSSTSYLENRSEDYWCEDLEDEYKPFTAADIDHHSSECKGASGTSVDAQPSSSQTSSPDIEDVKIKCSDIPLKPVLSRKTRNDGRSRDQDSWRSKSLQVGASLNMRLDVPHSRVPVTKLEELGPAPVAPVAPHRLPNIIGAPALRSELQQPPTRSTELICGKDVPADTSASFQSNFKRSNVSPFSSISPEENSFATALPYMSNLSNLPPNAYSGNDRVSGTRISPSQTTSKPFLPPNPLSLTSHDCQNAFSPSWQSVKTEKTNETSSRPRSTHESPIKESWRVSRAFSPLVVTANSEKINSEENLSRYSESEGPNSLGVSLEVKSNSLKASPIRSVMNSNRDTPNTNSIGIVPEITAGFPFQPNALTDETDVRKLTKIDVFKAPPPIVAMHDSSPTNSNTGGLQTKFPVCNTFSSTLGVTRLSEPSGNHAHRTPPFGITESTGQHTVKAIRNVTTESADTSASTPVEYHTMSTDKSLEQPGKSAIRAHSNSPIKSSRNASQNRWVVGSHERLGEHSAENRSYTSASPTASHDQPSNNLPKNDSLASIASSNISRYIDCNITSSSPSPSLTPCSPTVSLADTDHNNSFIVPDTPLKLGPSSPEKSATLKIFSTPDMVKLQHSVPRKEWKPPERSATPPPSPWQSLSVRYDNLSLPSPVAGSSGYQSKNQTHIYQFLQQQASLIRPNTEPSNTKEPVSKEPPILSKVPHVISTKAPSTLKKQRPISEGPISTTKSSLSISMEPFALQKTTKLSSVTGEKSLTSSPENESSEFSINFPGLNPSNMFPDAPKFTIKKNEPASCSSDQLFSNDAIVEVQGTTEPASDSLVSMKSRTLEPGASDQDVEINDEDVPYSPASKYSESDDDRLVVAAEEVEVASAAEESTQENQISSMDPKDDEISLEFEDMVELLRNFTSLEVEEQMAFSKYLRSLKVRDPKTIEKLYSRAKMNE
ncbi:Zinc finger CCCH-type [Trinorchestia longiramus]|nr:Zinc finger CCCH-type [Trinorchestia longiramus]